VRRFFIIVLLFLPAVVLGGWLLSEQLPILLAPQWWWIGANTPGGAPAACEAATSLRLYNGERVLFEQSAISAADARTAADRFIAQHYAVEDENAAVPIEYGGPSLFRATLTGERRLVWLYTARIATSHVVTLPGTDMPGAAVIVYLDANTGDVLALLSAVGAGAAEVMCPFPLRDWVVAAARSTPFVALAGYAGLLLALGALLLGYRIIRNLRKKL
jgi:hypothetical protein